MAELIPVTDPELLRQLESGGDQPVTDPALLAQLEGQAAPTALPQDTGMMSQIRDYLGMGADIAKPAVLPMAGGMAGRAAGTALAGPVGAVPGEAVGSMIGEGANQLTGITDPSIIQVIAAGASGPIMRGIGAGFQASKRVLARTLPGAGAALRQEAIAMAQGLTQGMRPSTPAEVLYDQVRQLDPLMGTGPLKAIANTLKSQEGELLTPAASTLTSNAAKLIDDLAAAPEQVGFKQLWATMRGINGLIDSAKRQGGPEYGALMQLKKGFLESMEQAAGADDLSAQARNLLGKANQAFKYELGADKIDEIIAKNFGRALEGTEQLSSRAAPAINTIKDAMRKEKGFLDLFPKGELDRIVGTLEEIAKLPVRGAPAGADAGSKNMLRRSLIGGAIGEIVARQMDAPPGMGAAVGTLAGVGAAEIISRSLQSDAGRKMLLKMARAPGGFDYPKLAALGMFIRAQTAETKEFQREFAESMKSRDVSLDDKIREAINREQMTKELSQSRLALEEY